MQGIARRKGTNPGTFCFRISFLPKGDACTGRTQSEENTIKTAITRWTERMLVHRTVTLKDIGKESQFVLPRGVLRYMYAI